MQRTKIEWTDYTWNMWSGCEPVSQGCKYCYAKRIADRGGRAFPNKFGLTLRPHKLNNISGFKPGDKVFVNSMSDFFFHKVEDEHRDSIIEAIKTRPEVNFQILTKRPIEMLAYLSKRPPLPDNVWLGVTVENQARVSLISALHETGHQSIKFISVEPLLGPIELDLEGIDWLIVGGESGQHLMDPELREERGLVERVDAEKGKPAYWRPSERGYRLVQDLMRQSLEAGVPFFFKQWGGYRASATGSILNNAHYKEFPKT